MPNGENTPKRQRLPERSGDHNKDASGQEHTCRSAELFFGVSQPPKIEAFPTARWPLFSLKTQDLRHGTYEGCKPPDGGQNRGDHPFMRIVAFAGS